MSLRRRISLQYTLIIHAYMHLHILYAYIYIYMSIVHLIRRLYSPNICGHLLDMFSLKLLLRNNIESPLMD